MSGAQCATLIPVRRVRAQEKFGNVIVLKLKDGQNSILPVYVGEQAPALLLLSLPWLAPGAHTRLPNSPALPGDFECKALVKEINKTKTVRPFTLRCGCQHAAPACAGNWQQAARLSSGPVAQHSSSPWPLAVVQVRPTTHDLMRDMLQALGHRVTKVRISTLVGDTYHAKVHFSRGRGMPTATGEVEVDARPSDAMNLAVRFGAPIYVNKEVAASMARPAIALEAHAAAHGAPHDENANEIARSCREEIMHYADPTIMHKLQLGLAIAEDRFEDATRLRDVIDRMLASDRALSLVVAMETALEDARYEEAARLRDEFRALRLALQGDEDGSHRSMPPPKLSDMVDL